MKRNILFLLIIFFTINITAQESDSLIVQISFGYPLGSHGINSMEYSNNFSFNVLYGLNGGVYGFEIGSIMNSNIGNVKGFQTAGVLNVNTGNSEGLILSGVSNICLDSTNGAIISGVFNYSKNNLKGFQTAGVLNINTGNSDGLILSGISNICLDSTNGAMISGVLNYSKNNSEGLQLSIVNINANEFEGFQLGIFNYAKKIKGFQLDIINILNDHTTGVPIGLISFVKNGYFDFELVRGESIYSNLNYKMGVERFYTIYKVGYSSFKNNPVYSFGIGFGENILFSERHKVSIDLSGNHISYTKWNNNKLNLLNKADFNYKYSFSKNVSFLVGTSFNVYITEVKVDNKFGTLNIPSTIYTKEYSNRKLFMWIGFNWGLSFNF